jgi:DNA-binding response OmpR family regulator
MLTSNSPKNIPRIPDAIWLNDRRVKKAQRVLCVDDDADSRKLVGMILEQIGLRVLYAQNGIEMLDMWRNNQIDLIIADINMPEMDGLEASERVRSVSSVPILILSANGMENDVVRGFEVGADDYIIKPFRPKELIVRVRSLLTRGEQDEQMMKQLAFDKLVLDLDARRLTSRGKTIQLSPLEFQILQYLMRNIGNVVSKEDLLQDVWGYRDSAGDLNLIEAAIKRLRKKLELDPSEPKYIQTVWGVGYRFGN